MSQPIFYIDLFSGAGGTTTGIHLANAKVKVIACVNHDLNAIESHRANHPDCVHLVEDIRDFQVIIKLKKIVTNYRRLFPDCIIALWASFECTNYSKAKGGLPRDADSRTLPYILYKYADELNPDYIDLENVREILSWGPLDKNNRPISRLNGVEYQQWRDTIIQKGYRYEYRLLNAADYGAHTSRVRYFAQFAKNDLPIVWPAPTHSKKPTGNLKRWKPVKEVLDLKNEGESIFTRKKPLAEKTLKRILAGLVKFVARGDDSFIQKYYSGHPQSKVFSLNSPAHTVTNIDHHSKVFIKRYNGGNPKYKVHSAEMPLGAISTKNRHALVQTSFLSQYYGNGFNSPVTAPSPTVTTRDRSAKVKINFMDQQYGLSKPRSLEKPNNAVTANPKFNLVHANPWIMTTNFNNVGAPLSMVGIFKPGGEVPNPEFFSHPPSGNPEKNNQQVFALPFFENENMTMQKIRIFMAHFRIIDIKMRMLTIEELKLIQGFPKNYILKGTQTSQKKYIGNAVVPAVPKHMVEARVEKLNAWKINPVEDYVFA